MLIFVLYLILCVGLSFVFDQKQVKGRRNYLMITGFVMIVIMGLRGYTVGADTYEYFSYPSVFQTYSWLTALTLNSNYGFNLFTKVLSCIAPQNPTIYLLSVATLIEISVCCFLMKYSTDLLFSRIMLLSLGFTFFFMTGVKQTMAMAVLLWACDALLENKNIRFLILTVVAALLHNTALIFLLAWPVLRLKLKKDWYFVAGFAAVCIAYLFTGQITALFQRIVANTYFIVYGNTIIASNNYTGLYIQLVIFCASAICLFSTRKGIEKWDNRTTAPFALYAIGLFFQTLTPIIAEFFRISMYFSILGIVMLPNALHQSTFKWKPFFRWACIGVFIVYFLLFSSRTAGVLPYTFCIM